MQTSDKLKEKKGLILVALLTAVMLGAYGARWYTWEIFYEVTPLTHNEVWDLGHLQGGENGTLYSCAPPPWSSCENMTLQHDKRIHFRINTTDLNSTFVDLNFTVDLFQNTTGPYLNYGNYSFPLVINQSAQYNYTVNTDLWAEYVIELDNLLAEEGDAKKPDYYIIKNVEFWIEALDEQHAGTIEVQVWGEIIVSPTPEE